MNSKVILIVTLILCQFVFGVTRHTPEENYVFKTETIRLPQDVNIPIKITDEGGGYRGNFFIVDVNLPESLYLTPIEYTEVYDPNLYGYSSLKSNVQGTLPVGEHKFMFHIEDSAGNDENAWLEIIVQPEDITPPIIKCGGKP